MLLSKLIFNLPDYSVCEFFLIKIFVCVCGILNTDCFLDAPSLAFYLKLFHVPMWPHSKTRCPLQYWNKVWSVVLASLQFFSIYNFLYDSSLSKGCTLIISCIPWCHQLHEFWLCCIWTLCKSYPQICRSNRWVFCFGIVKRFGMWVINNVLSLVAMTQDDYEIKWTTNLWIVKRGRGNCCNPGNDLKLLIFFSVAPYQISQESGVW